MSFRKWSGTLLTALALSGSVVTDSRSGEGSPEQGFWNDPTFQKQFMGSYGTASEVEPRVTTVEREQMEEVLQRMQEGDADGAIAELEEILRRTPRRGEAEPSAIFDFTLGNLLFQREELQEASVYYTRAIDKFPAYRRAHKNLGLIAVRRGDFEPGTRHLSRVIELGGADGTTFGLLGYAYSSTEQYIAAESAYRNAMLLQRDVLDWKIGLTHSLLKQRKYPEAVTLCQELIQQYPERSDFWLMQANAYIGLEKPLEAAKNYEIVQRMGKATLQSQQTLGDIYVNEELWDLAVLAYANALEIDPEQPVQRPLRAVEVLAQRGALDQARVLMTRVRENYGDRLEDDERMKLLKLEARMAVSEGEGGEAVQVLEEIVALEPLDGEALLLLGQHYARSDEMERAEFYYERAESIDGYEAEAKVRHAQLLVTQSRYAEAVPLLKRAQELDFRDDVANYLQQVERIARTQR